MFLIDTVPVFGWHSPCLWLTAKRSGDASRRALADRPRRLLRDENRMVPDLVRSESAHHAGDMR